MGYFSAERVAELHAGRNEIDRQYATLRERFFLRTYKTEKGAEHAKHGFCRRLGTLKSAIETVYNLLPPEWDDIPTDSDVINATTAIQAFTFNAFGCLENGAWMVASEKGMKKKNGKPLPPKRIGLRVPEFTQQLSKEFAAVLEKHKAWFDNLTSFRDGLAHRIPLYVPPYVVSKENLEQYNALEKKKWEEPARSDPDEYEKLKEQQVKLCRFVPAMTHSILNSAPHIEFHSQLLNDYVTIDEFAHEVLDELDR